jgi:hypothetical protein
MRTKSYLTLAGGGHRLQPTDCPVTGRIRTGLLGGTHAPSSQAGARCVRAPRAPEIHRHAARIRAIAGARGEVCVGARESGRVAGTQRTKIADDRGLGFLRKRKIGSGAWTRTRILGSKGPCATDCTTPEWPKKCSRVLTECAAVVVRAVSAGVYRAVCPGKLTPDLAALIPQEKQRKTGLKFPPSRRRGPSDRATPPDFRAGLGAWARKSGCAVFRMTTNCFGARYRYAQRALRFSSACSTRPGRRPR